MAEDHRVLTPWPTAGAGEGRVDPEGKGKSYRAGETLGPLPSSLVFSENCNDYGFLTQVAQVSLADLISL